MKFIEFKKVVDMPLPQIRNIIDDPKIEQKATQDKKTSFIFKKRSIHIT
jgi:hypothetical protein